MEILQSTRQKKQRQLFAKYVQKYRYLSILGKQCQYLVESDNKISKIVLMWDLPCLIEDPAESLGINDFGTLEGGFAI